MNAKDREILRQLVDQRARERAATGYMNCDPEYLSRSAIEADEKGVPELASALRNFRDQVVNPLIGEGWTVDRIEQAAYRHFKRYS